MIYEKNQSTSFAIGMFASIELIKNRPEKILRVYYSSKIKINENVSKFFELCGNLKIELIEKTKLVERISGKENVFVVTEFSKFEGLLENGNHLVLVNPSDMGNLGTILRTALGFGVKNIAIIKPCVDIFDPKVIRASQGAIFKTNVQLFSSFEEYNAKFEKNKKYMFCLGGEDFLQSYNIKSCPFSLVFGNEATGLDENVIKFGEKIKIRQSDDIDSFNLAISVALGLYEFTK